MYRHENVSQPNCGVCEIVGSRSEIFIVVEKRDAFLDVLICVRFVAFAA